MIDGKQLWRTITDPENQPHQYGKMVWNGNELVFEGLPEVGIAGVAPGLPDEFGEEIARRWNEQERGTAINSRYAAALKVWEEFNIAPEIHVSFGRYLKERLNSVGPNHA